jgi:hypothetical protein
MTLKQDDEYKPFFQFNVATKCYKCKKTVYGRLVVSKTLQVIDSPGFMMFGDKGIECECCMCLEGMSDPNLPIGSEHAGKRHNKKDLR